ncbi:MAG: hydrolase [Alphaproteobacteria bacterium RIFOXYD12_FULL_60_8]|nr:MAG: hydrolase [Alphaproteobacteria bacterium RIFOXYD12_FULL_60_8]
MTITAPTTKITVLGCGSAGGVPMVSWGWGNCDPNNPKNRRLRPSILVERGGTTVLVDTTPDLREQLLRSQTRRIDAVFYTHEHADHVHGLDDLREINRAMQAPIPVYAAPHVLTELEKRFGYAFAPFDPGKYPIYKPWLEPHAITGPFRVGEVEAIPFEQDHGYTTSLGFRFGDMAYCTDVVNLDEAAFTVLAGVRTWILCCFTDKPHQTHVHLDKALEWIERLKPERTYLTHMGPKLDYDTLRSRLPAGVEPAYDGLILQV